MRQCNILQNYVQIFDDDIKPVFLQKYYNTMGSHNPNSCLQRIRYISQFYGKDYTNMYNAQFFYTKFYHSLVSANMMWHFTRNKKYTIAALLHEIGAPCFSNSSDLSLKNNLAFISNDKELMELLRQDGITLDELEYMFYNTILKSKDTKLSIEAIDKVFTTCFIFNNTYMLEEIKEVYDDLCVLENENGDYEIGFRNVDKGVIFSQMVYNYLTDVKTIKNQYVIQYMKDIIMKAIQMDLISLENLYTLKEKDLVQIFKNSFDSWNEFEKAKRIKTTNKKISSYNVEFENNGEVFVPLVQTGNGIKRVNDVSPFAAKIYEQMGKNDNKKYGYVKKIKNI